jgi:hypothetical protein
MIMSDVKPLRAGKDIAASREKENCTTRMASRT